VASEFRVDVEVIIYKFFHDVIKDMQIVLQWWEQKKG
jgi:hypothetical protein